MISCDAQQSQLALYWTQYVSLKVVSIMFSFDHPLKGRPMFMLVVIYLLSYLAGLLIILYAVAITVQAAEADALLGFTPGVFTLASGIGFIIFGALIHAANRAINLLTEIRDNQINDFAYKPRPTPQQIEETKKQIAASQKKPWPTFSAKD